MTINRAPKNLLFYVILPLIALLFTLPPPCSAANFPLEITNIKPAGTGTPAIPVTNRIFRAYPGIEYNIRAAVIGGAYPFTYKLENSPAGMTINPKTGEISWPAPKSDSGTITLTVKDSENTTVTTTWAITVTTKGFLFVDASYTGTETGTITQPFNSIASLLQKTSAANVTDITYFRGGTYTLIQFGSTYSKPGDVTGKYGTNLKDSSHTWIGYPGETIKINGDGRYMASLLGLYFDSLNLSDFSDYGIQVTSKTSYMTMRRCSWSKIVAVNSVNENQGFFFTWDGGDGYYLVLQDNSFSDFTGTSAIGSLYATKKALIENNHIFNPGGPGISHMCNGIAPKYRTDYLTVRANKIVMDSGTPLGSSLNGMLDNANNVEICFNLFMRKTTPSERAEVHVFNADGYSSAGAMKTLFYHRNTVVGDVNFMFINGANCTASGPYNLYNNVIINPNTTWGGHYYTSNFLSFNWGANMAANPNGCINDVDNLKGTPESNIIDDEGNLTSGYFPNYFGTHGFQIGLPAPKLINIDIMP
ncbi:MAG: hypothetical protein FP815_05375 [Desulfobulbaceae bacterium]|nr:hypothetical protein [Desulfobulbaceae bacterium]